ncbi:MAG: hypothetical protein M1834_001443 [Cirrosporium novae-zelandiae]|nr:MAG: hypothetical protein M1834_001443 [Cirrosporium novae-zelandiae]
MFSLASTLIFSLILPTITEPPLLYRLVSSFLYPASIFTSSPSSPPPSTATPPIFTLPPELTLQILLSLPPESLIPLTKSHPHFDSVFRIHKKVVLKRMLEDWFFDGGEVVEWEEDGDDDDGGITDPECLEEGGSGRKNNMEKKGQRRMEIWEMGVDFWTQFLREGEDM